MKKTLLILLMLSALPTLATGQIVDIPCKTCGKPIKECNYAGNHPKPPSSTQTSQPSQQRRSTATTLTVNGSADDAEWSNIPASGAGRTFTVHTNDRNGFSLSSSGQAWIRIKKESPTTFSVMVDENKLQQRRGGNIIVSAGNRQVRIMLNQNAAAKRTRDSYLMVNDDSSSVQTKTCYDYSGCSFLMTVQTDLPDYTITGVPSWCSIENRTSSTFTLKVNYNSSSSERSDYFNVQAGGKSVKIIIKQAGRPESKRRLAFSSTYNYLGGLSVGYTNMILSNTNVSGELVWGNVGKRIGGFQVGYHLQKGYTDLAGIGYYTGIFYNRYHSSVGDNYHTSFKESAVVLPAHVYYCLKLPLADLSLWVHTGPDIEYFFGARYHDKNDNYRDWSPAYDGKGWYNHVNLAYSLNIGLQYDRLLLDIGLTWGLNNHKIYEAFNNGTKTHINQFTIKLSYLIND